MSRELRNGINTLKLYHSELKVKKQEILKELDLVLMTSLKPNQIHQLKEARNKIQGIKL